MMMKFIQYIDEWIDGGGGLLFGWVRGGVGGEGGGVGGVGCGRGI